MLSGLDSAGLSRHKTCLLMAAAATLQIAKTTADELEKVGVIVIWGFAGSIDKIMDP